MKYPFLKEETVGLRTQVTFVGDELLIYLPKYYLDKDSVFGEILGNKIDVIGLFWFKTGGKMYEMALPIRMTFEYDEEIEPFKGKLRNDLPICDYRVFKLRKGDALCHDIMHVIKIDDLESMLLKIIDQGKMPATVSYDEAITLFHKLMLATKTGSKLGVGSVMVEVLLSEIYRNKHNPTQPFRKLLNSSSSASMYDFKQVRLTKVPQMNSVFNSLIGEDTFNQIANCVVRVREGHPDRPSPMEKLMKL